MAASKSRRRRRGPSSQLTPGLGAGASQFASAYLNALNDPFEYGGIKLGYDCFVPTTLFTAYSRRAITVNADGSFAAYSFPGMGTGFVSTNVSGANAATWNAYAADNSGAAYSNYRAGRFISGGIRAIALVSGTVAPGVLFAGTFPIISRADLAANSPTFFSGLLSSHIGIGSAGAVALSRPQDNDSFVFWPGHVLGWSTSALSEASVPYIAGLGFAAGTQVWIETVQNFECIQNNTNTAVASSNDMPNPEPAASDFFPSPERLMSVIRPYLANAGLMDAVGVAAQRIHPALGLAASAARHAFGTGRNIRTPSYQNDIQAVSRESAKMMEEVKEDYGRDEL